MREFLQQHAISVSEVLLLCAVVVTTCEFDSRGHGLLVVCWSPPTNSHSTLLTILLFPAKHRWPTSARAVESAFGRQGYQWYGSSRRLLFGCGEEGTYRRTRRIYRRERTLRIAEDLATFAKGQWRAGMAGEKSRGEGGCLLLAVVTTERGRCVFDRSAQQIF